METCRALTDLVALYLQRGTVAYEGEGVTQLQHAQQCAELARLAGASEAMQLAAWLHDVGHLLSELSGTPTLRMVDDRHEQIAAIALRDLLPVTVVMPIALHVQAKRYLVSTRAEYFSKLSEDSKRSLLLQGGPMSPKEVFAFERHPFRHDALRLRSWDEAAKTPDTGPPGENLRTGAASPGRDADVARLVQLLEAVNRTPFCNLHARNPQATGAGT